MLHAGPGASFGVCTLGLAERESAERRQLAGVDLDTRRRRVLEELALKGRTGEQARLREELADAVRAFQ